MTSQNQTPIEVWESNPTEGSEDYSLGSYFLPPVVKTKKNMIPPIQDRVNRGKCKKILPYAKSERYTGQEGTMNYMLVLSILLVVV